ncbi:MAG: methyltransferase domain-containing protein [Candidatus Binatia bacterium]
MTARQSWSSASHEASVERFYSQGVNSDTEIHRGFLNFGLWEDGVDEYVAAAQNLVRRMATMLGLGAGSRLLDVACGMGSQDVYLHRTVPGLEIDAVDVTWRHVERAVRRARDEGIEGGVRFHHGSATALPFAPRSFTHVMSIEGPEHFRTRRRFFAEARRVLRPGGVMALADYTITRAPRRAAERLVVDLSRRLWRIPRENLWTAAQYRDELRAAGFVDATVESVGPLTFPGYYREQCRPAFRAEMRRLQGQVKERLGHLIDVVTNRAYERGLVDYVLVRAVQPSEAVA